MRPKKHTRDILFEGNNIPANRKPLVDFILGCNEDEESLFASRYYSKTLDMCIECINGSNNPSYRIKEGKRGHLLAYRIHNIHIVLRFFRFPLEEMPKYLCSKHDFLRSIAMYRLRVGS